MKTRVLLILATGALIALVVWMTSRPAVQAPENQETSAPVTATAPPPADREFVAPPENPPHLPPEILPGEPPVAAQTPRFPESRASSRRDLAYPLVPSSIPDNSPATSSNTDAATAIDLDKITLMFRDYRTITGGNPVGTNAEIMKSIMGGNPKGAMLGPPEGQTLNENGELIDRWGTPYFFHQLTKDLMEIHSAGPDRRMGSDDDIISK